MGEWELREILEMLFELAKKKRDDLLHNISTFSIMSWINEISTIRFGGTRQIGHSTAIAYMTRKFNRPMVIVPREEQIETILNTYNEDGVPNLLQIFDVEDFFRRVNKRQPGTFDNDPAPDGTSELFVPDAVFVDCASYLGNQYNMLSGTVHNGCVQVQVETKIGQIVDALCRIPLGRNAWLFLVG